MTSDGPAPLAEPSERLRIAIGYVRMPTQGNVTVGSDRIAARSGRSLRAYSGHVRSGDASRVSREAERGDLRRLVLEWDPIGVADFAPDDEYDCLIGPLLGQLSRGADQAALAKFLRHELRSHFGVDPADDEIEAMSARLVSRFGTVRRTESNL